jgi:hypothetical protein
VLGFLRHAIRDALFEALEVLVDIPLVFEQHVALIYRKLKKLFGRVDAGLPSMVEVAATVQVQRFLGSQFACAKTRRVWPS